jgi:putative ABC transport system permease protein
MKRVGLLAWRYVCFHRAKTVILVIAMTVIMALPLTVHRLVRSLETGLVSRAHETPLVLGPRGSRFDLVLHALYFKSKVPLTIPMRVAQGVSDSGLALGIPLHHRFAARGYPIVGTSAHYFAFRGLEPAVGSGLERLGDCVLGDTVAQRLQLAPGTRLMSDAENVFDIAGSYPVNMRVTGVLPHTGTPDDDAVFVGVNTAWLIEGRCHGHADSGHTYDPEIESGTAHSNEVAAAALEHYAEVTGENVDSFHFHGDFADFPITAVLVVPDSKKSETLLRGRYQDHEALQVLVPLRVVEELVGVVFRVKRFLDANLVLVGLAVCLLLALVILLSLRLRRREMEIMFMLGCARRMTLRLQVAELGIVLAVSLALAAAAARIAAWVAPSLLGV